MSLGFLVKEVLSWSINLKIDELARIMVLLWQRITSLNGLSKGSKLNQKLGF
jgi:hypothetical protein